MVKRDHAWYYRFHDNKTGEPISEMKFLYISPDNKIRELLIPENVIEHDDIFIKLFKKGVL